MEQEGQEWMDLAEDFTTDSGLSGKFDDELAKRDVIGAWSVPPEYVYIDSDSDSDSDSASED